MTTMALLQTTVSKGECKRCKPQSAAVPKPTVELLFICNIYNKPKINHLQKTVLWVVALANISKKAWSLVAAAIPTDAHRIDTLLPARFELGPWPLPPRAQPQVPTAIRLPTDTNLPGTSFPVAYTHAARWAQEDPSRGHTGGHRHKQCHHVSLVSLGSQPRTHP